jgi:RimJ/RimL family protein N-acetyltransferase
VSQLTWPFLGAGREALAIAGLHGAAGGPVMASDSRLGRRRSGGPGKIGSMTTLPTLSAAVIESDRVVLRKARDADREGIVEEMADPDVRAYLGGPRPREGVDRFLDTAVATGATAEAGSYVIADGQTGRFVGILGLARRAADRPGHVTGEGAELELSCVLRRGAWGAGLAFEAAAAALRAAAGELPDQPVLVVTQSANDRSRRLAGRLGFQEIGQFEEFGARQVLAVASLGSFREE